MNTLVFHLFRSLMPRSLRSVCQMNYSQLTQKNFAPRPWKAPNPGIGKRMKIIEEDAVAPNSQEFENMDLEDLESDFMQVGGMYNQHSSEIKNRKEKNKLQIVKHKYFKKEVQPNFLTWDEKEQIRYLHDSDTVEWSIEKLAISFPASESVIRKIIKARWKPDDANAIQRHDNTAQTNWQLLFQGKLEIEPDLKKHLVKFSKRRMVIPSVPPNSTVTVVCETSTTGNKNSEFLNIIKSYKESVADRSRVGLKSLEASIKDQEDGIENINYSLPNYSQIAPKGDTYIVDGSKSRKGETHFTLSTYRHTFNTLPEEKTMQQKSFGEEKTFVMNQNQTTQISRHSTSSTGIIPNKAGELLSQNTNIKNYPDKIVIPKNKWKEGGTYKVGDCFYDDDGTFLYRVPGMT